MVGVAVRLGHSPVDEVGDDHHLGRPHALGRHRGCAHPDPGGRVRRLRVERYGVLVQHDAGGVRARLGFLAGHPDPLKVMEGQMGVRASRDRTNPLLPQRSCELLGIGDDLLGIGFVGWLGALEQVDRLGCDDVHQRAALHHREHRLVELRGVLLLAHEHPATRSTQDLVRREGDDVGIRHRARDRLAGDQPDEVRRVDPEDGAHLVSEVTEELEVDQPRDRRAAGHDELGPVDPCQLGDLGIVDVLALLVHPVVHGVEPLAAEGDLRTVGQVTAMRQGHRQEGVARLQKGAVDGHVGAGPGVRLEVGMVGAEQCLGPFDADRLGLVDLGAASVVPAPRVALGILVGQGGTHCGQHRRAGEVLAGDQLEAAAHALELGEQHRGDLRVLAAELTEVGAVEGLVHGHGVLPAMTRW